MVCQTRKSRFALRTNRCTESVSPIWESVTPNLDRKILSRQVNKAGTSSPPTSYSPRPASGRGVGGEGYSIAASGKQNGKLWESESSTTDHSSKFFCEVTE